MPVMRKAVIIYIGSNVRATISEKRYKTFYFHISQ